MPFICLVREDIPAGTVYIKSLRSESLRVPAYDPPGQARYVNRVQNDPLYLSATGVVLQDTYGLAAYLADTVEPTVGMGDVWTAAQLNEAAALIIGQMDAGGVLTEAAINNLINQVQGVDNVDVDSANSTFEVEEMLSIMAGRGYLLPAGASKISAVKWDLDRKGGFGKTVMVHDTRMLGGEIRPMNVGGDPVLKEIKPIRHTYVSKELLDSIADGEIAVFMAKLGMPPVTLWPQSGVIPRFPWAYQKNLFEQVDSATVIVVYNDNGTLMV